MALWRGQENNGTEPERLNHIDPHQLRLVGSFLIDKANYSVESKWIRATLLNTILSWLLADEGGAAEDFPRI